MIAATSLSGCVYVEKIFPPSPTRVPVVVITPTPTPVPVHTATPAPTPVARQMSSDVIVMPYGDKGIVTNSFNSEKDAEGEQQREIFTVVLANNGNDVAKNVVITLVESDAHGSETLVQQKFNIGDLSPGDRKEYAITTDYHNLATSVMITITPIEWGENGEYYNPTKFINLARSIWA